MYNRYFGFLESPFSVTPDPRFFYNNPVYLEAYANLRYGIEAKKGFIAITGEVGTGKTTLLRKLMRNLQSSIHSVFIFNTAVSFNELLRLILSDLGLPAEGKDRLAMIESSTAIYSSRLRKAISFVS
jgi:general secretion pathway protein A